MDFSGTFLEPTFLTRVHVLTHISYTQHVHALIFLLITHNLRYIFHINIVSTASLANLQSYEKMFYYYVLRNLEIIYFFILSENFLTINSGSLLMRPSLLYEPSHIYDTHYNKNSFLQLFCILSFNSVLD